MDRGIRTNYLMLNSSLTCSVLGDVITCDTVIYDYCTSVNVAFSG